MMKKNSKKVEIEIVNEIKTGKYFLNDHGITIAVYEDGSEIDAIAKRFEDNDKYNVTFTRI